MDEVRLALTRIKGTKSAQNFYEYIRSLAGEEIKTKSEARGARELAIFKSGVTL